LIVKVNYLSMPNILADEELFPEFIQESATRHNLARAALDLLRDEERRRYIKTKLADIVLSLGGTGASRRAADAVVSLI
jgi:lipid-A-disaccharide synthase